MEQILLNCVKEKTMQVLTKRDLVDAIAKRWKQQYPGDTGSQILSELMALNKPTEQQVSDIIGNQSWTTNTCTECGKNVNVVVLLGYEPVLDNWGCKLCLDCVQKALHLAVLHSGSITSRVLNSENT